MIADNIELLCAGICLKDNQLYQNPVIRPFIDAYLKHKKPDEKFKLFDIYGIGYFYGDSDQDKYESYITKLIGDPLYLCIGYVYKNYMEKFVPCFLKMEIHQHDMWVDNAKIGHIPELLFEIFDIVISSEVINILYEDTKFIKIGDLYSYIRNMYADKFEFVIRFKKNYQREDYINFYQYLDASDPKHESYIEKLSKETEKYI